MSLWQKVLDKAVGVFTPSEADLRRSARKQGEMALRAPTPQDLRGKSTDPLGDIAKRQKGPGARGAPDLTTDRRPKPAKRIFDMGITDVGADVAPVTRRVKALQQDSTKLNQESMRIYETNYNRLLREGWLPEEIVAELGPRPVAYQPSILFPGSQVLEDFLNTK